MTGALAIRRPRGRDLAVCVTLAHDRCEALADIFLVGGTEKREREGARIPACARGSRKHAWM